MNTHSALAILHNDDAVLERHHARTTFIVLQQKNSNIFLNFTEIQFSVVRKVIIRAILATDMQCHFAQLKTVDTLYRDGFDPKNSESRLILINTLVHACDLSAQVQPLKCALKWGDRIVQEFQSQVIKEDKLNLPSAPFMLNLDKPLPRMKLQMNFCTHVLLPYWRVICKIIPQANCCLNNLEVNMKHYRDQVAALEDKSSA